MENPVGCSGEGFVSKINIREGSRKSNIEGKFGAAGKLKDERKYKRR